MRTATSTPSAPIMPVAWPVTKRIKPVKKRFPCILDEPKTIGHYLEPLKDIASNPDRQRLLKEFFQETYGKRLSKYIFYSSFSLLTFATKK